MGCNQVPHQTDNRKRNAKKYVTNLNQDLTVPPTPCRLTFQDYGTDPDKAGLHAQGASDGQYGVPASAGGSFELPPACEIIQLGEWSGVRPPEGGTPCSGSVDCSGKMLKSLATMMVEFYKEQKQLEEI